MKEVENENADDDDDWDPIEDELEDGRGSFIEFEIQRLLDEVSEIKHLLFCRLLLRHAALLPAALRADSIEAFFEDKEVTSAALRDVCFKMEKPSLQEIRDACADFFRSEEEEEEEEEEKQKSRMSLKRKRRGELPGTWRSKRELSREATAENMLERAPGMASSIGSILGGAEGGAIDFGDSTNLRQVRKKIRVKGFIMYYESSDPDAKDLSMERHRQWNFSFKDYYDIYVWDLEPGDTLAGLFNTVQQHFGVALAKTCTNQRKSILKTLYRDQDSNYRDVRPGDPVQFVNQWDYLQDGRSKFFYGDIDGPNPLPTEPTDLWPSNLFYNKADALEDEVLFPEERTEEASNALFVEGTWNWESEDSETSDEAEDSEYEPLWTHESPIEDDGNDEYEDVDVDNDDDEDDDMEDESKDFPKELWPVVNRLAVEKTYKNDFPNHDLEGEFIRFIEKTTSRTFKKAWHTADVTPNGHEQYLEMKRMAHKSWKYNHTREDFFGKPSTILNFQVMSWLDVTADDVKDAQKAMGKVYPFFNPEFLETEEGKEFKDSLMFNQEERAKYYPDIRTDKSTIHHPKEFYADLDKSRQKMKFTDDYTSFPLEWDMTIRPIIAKLYKSGIIRSHASTEASCQAFQGTEAIRPSRPDLFVDWRSVVHNLEMPEWMEDPGKNPTPYKHCQNVLGL
ncbi:hypothetical protein DID88_001440 [Monilinia fructigena]|uniref:Uncharacterized protein n=1 Tax=Monilinia fructigena TaxID=38457 RepID=A0A395IY87_9HELO|nr:hypothetical protein DID88_001440 [Monilinia fructigena]